MQNFDTILNITEQLENYKANLTLKDAKEIKMNFMEHTIILNKFFNRITNSNVFEYLESNIIDDFTRCLCEKIINMYEECKKIILDAKGQKTTKFLPNKDIIGVKRRITNDNRILCIIKQLRTELDSTLELSDNVSTEISELYFDMQEKMKKKNQELYY